MMSLSAGLARYWLYRANYVFYWRDSEYRATFITLSCQKTSPVPSMTGFCNSLPSIPVEGASMRSPRRWEILPAGAPCNGGSRTSSKPAKFVPVEKLERSSITSTGSLETLSPRQARRTQTRLVRSMSRFRQLVLNFGIACDESALSVSRSGTDANSWMSIVRMKHDICRRTLSIICTVSDAHR